MRAEGAPIWRNLAAARIEAYRDLCDVYLGDNAALEAHFGTPGPFWGRHYVLYSGGGGGFGDPHTRALEAVLRDVQQGYVSIGSAAREYGVVIDPHSFQIDFAATSALRSGDGKLCPGDPDS